MGLKTTVVGSYPAPHWMIGSTDRTVLRDAIMAVFKTQELAGIDLVTDGNLCRFDPNHPESNRLIDYFVRRMDGIRTKYTVTDMQRFKSTPALQFRADAAGVVVGQLEDGTLNLPDDWEFARQLTKHPLKFTCTGPHTLTKALMDRHYGSPRGVSLGFARVLKQQLQMVGADVVQVDETDIIHNPDDTEWALPAINMVLEGVSGERAVHVCFANSGSREIGKDAWAALLPFLKGLNASHVVLEFARRGFDGLDAIKDMDPKIGFGIGVVDVMNNLVESPDEIAKRIEHAADVLGRDRISYVHPDCGLWMLHRSVADAKMRALVEGRNLFEGSH